MYNNLVNYELYLMTVKIVPQNCIKDMVDSSLSLNELFCKILKFFHGKELETYQSVETKLFSCTFLCFSV